MALEGVAALLGSAAFTAALPWIGGAAALTAIVLSIGAVFNGMKDDFKTDLGDLLESIRLLQPAEEDDYSKSLLVKSEGIVLEIQELLALYESDLENPSTAGQAISGIEEKLTELDQFVNKYNVTKRNWLPNMATDFASSVLGRVSDLKASWKDLFNVASEESKAVAVNMAKEKKKRSKAPGGAGVVPSRDHPEVAKERERPAESLEQRTLSMQKFLLRIPDRFWDDAGFTEVEALDKKGADGVMDELTQAALDSFAEFISDELGVANLTGPRLEREGNGQKLRELWQIFRNPHKYMEKAR